MYVNRNFNEITWKMDGTRNRATYYYHHRINPTYDIKIHNKKLIQTIFSIKKDKLL